MDAFARDRGPGYFKDRYTIGYWFWELEQFRPDWLPAFQLVDEVWVASEFSRAAIGANAPVPVVHMPLGIETPVPGPFGRAHFGLPAHPFIFLYTFDVSSHMERKNPLGAIRAFRQAGFDHDEAVLLLKFTNGHTDRAAVRRLAEAASGLNVTLLDVVLSRPEVSALMHCTDACFSLSSRQGFFWWEVDFTWYMLRGLQAVGLIHDLKGIPTHIKYSKNKQHAQELKRQQDASRGPVSSAEGSKVPEKTEA
jgi:hypothetical protein